MNSGLKAKLNLLRQNYEAVTGKTFDHFYCPILHTDEETELCKAHITNKALNDNGINSKLWTVQRKDVDNFFGRHFEADFVLIQYDEDEAFDKALFEDKSSSKLNPKVLLNDEEIPFFVANGNIQPHFSPVLFESETKSIPIVLKIEPEVFQSNAEGKWEVEVSKDIRLASVVSLLKAAHMTMFELFGYTYALSKTGRFIGYDILGKFFRENQKNRSELVLENASAFFQEYLRMARPVTIQHIDFKGTINDRKFLICKDDDGQYWGWIVFVKSANKMNVVLLPLDTNNTIPSQYYEFIEGTEETIDVQCIQYIDGYLQIDSDIYEIEWGSGKLPS
jgi:hypothetical protein